MSVVSSAREGKRGRRRRPMRGAHVERNGNNVAQRVKGRTCVRLNKVTRLRRKVRGVDGRVEK